MPSTYRNARTKSRKSILSIRSKRKNSLTAGIDSCSYFYDLASCANGVIYLASSSGIYRWHPDSTRWEKLTLPAGLYPTQIFIDRLNRMYLVSGYPYKSTDQGMTWFRDTAGILQSGFFSKIFDVDSGGAIFSSFATLNLIAFTVNYHGVYWTTDNGALWTSVGLDSVAIQQLHAFGDTVYSYHVRARGYQAYAEWCHAEC